MITLHTFFSSLSSTQLRRGSLFLFVFLLCVLFSPFASAQDEAVEGLPIDVAGAATRTRHPIAVPKAIPIGKENPSVARELVEVMERDFQISGIFKILPRSSFYFDTRQEGHTSKSIKFRNWTSVGADNLVKARYEMVGDRVKLDLRLFRVDNGSRVAIEWTSRTVSRDQVRDAVHEFVNAAIKYFTGVPGMFGTKIVFAQATGGNQKHIFTVDIDGARRTRVSNNASINVIPSWGKRGIYYTSYKTSNPNLYLQSGSKVSKISARPGQNSGAAECGSKLALTLSNGGDNTDIYLLDPESGKVVKRLTSHWGIDTTPTWSPDCSKIAFVSDRSGGPQIFLMNADGSNQKRLTFKGRHNTTPDWSPEGDKIVFTGLDGDRSDIFTVGLDGAMERLTQDQGRNEEPSYSPNGRYIAFLSTRGGGGHKLFVMTSDGNIQTQITKKGGISTPSWQR